MKEWRVHRYVTDDDKDLARVLNKIEAKPGYNVHQVIHIGHNLSGQRIYQFIYTVEK